MQLTNLAHRCFLTSLLAGILSVNSNGLTLELDRTIAESIVLPETITSVSSADHGRYLVCLTENDVFTLNLVKGEVVSQVKHQLFRPKLFTGDNLIGLRSGNQLRFYDLQSGELRGSLKLAGNLLSIFFVNGKNDQIYVATTGSVSHGIYHIKGRLIRKISYVNRLGQMLHFKADNYDPKKNVFYSESPGRTFKIARHMKGNVFLIHDYETAPGKPYALPSGFLKGSQLYSNRLRWTKTYSQDGGELAPALKPVDGIDGYYAGYTETGIYIFSSLQEKPLYQWLKIKNDHRSLRDVTSGFGVSAAWGIGYIVDKFKQEVLIVPFDKSKLPGASKNVKPLGNRHGGTHLNAPKKSRPTFKSGELFEYQLKFPANFANPVFRLLAKPSGMTVNSAGELKWLPPESINRAVRITAKVTAINQKPHLISILIVPEGKR